MYSRLTIGLQGKSKPWCTCHTHSLGSGLIHLLVLGTMRCSQTEIVQS